MNAIIKATPKREYGFFSCPHCGRAVLLFQNRSWMCAPCGHGSFNPIPEEKIVWLSRAEAELKVGFNNFLRIDINSYLNRIHQETS